MKKKTTKKKAAKKKVKKESTYPVHCNVDTWELYCKKCSWKYKLIQFENAIVRANKHAKGHNG